MFFLEFVERMVSFFFFFQAEDGIRDRDVTGVQTCALPISQRSLQRSIALRRRPGGCDTIRHAGAVWPGSEHAVAPFCTQGFLFLRPTRAASCAGYSISATSSPQCCRTDASHRASDGLIWPKDGCASIACAATAAVRLSSPGLRPFLARQEIGRA